ncbi:MAG: phage portal protein, partial [Vicinamibacteria bacterium]
MASAFSRLNPLGLLGSLVAKADPRPKSPTEVALFQRSEPPRRDTREFMAAWDKLPWMRAVVEKIAYAKASVRWTVAAVPGKKSDGEKFYRKTAISKIRNKQLRRKAMTEAEAERLDDHPLVVFFADPNPLLTPLDVSMLITAFQYVGGESFQILEAHPPAKIPNIMWPFPPHWCKQTPTPARPEFYFDNGLGLRQWIPMERVLWRRGLNLLNPFGRSRGLFMTMEDELSSYENASQLVNYSFYNKNRPDVIVSLEGASDIDITAADAKWTGKFEGIAQSFRSFFTNRKVKVDKISGDFVHSQLIELLSFMRDAQIQIPGVPKELMAVTESSNRATIVAARDIFWGQVVEPLLEQEREFYQKHLVPIFDDRIILDYDNPTPEDKDFSLSALNGGKVIVR